MITDDDIAWQCHSVKRLPALRRGTTSNHYGDFYCLNCFHSHRTLNKLKKPSGYAWCATRYFYRGKDCIENFCNYLKELGTEIINFEEKEMMPLTNKEIKSYEKQKYAIYVKKNFVTIKTTKS